MSPARRTALLVLLALLGIVVAAVITWGTSQLVSQRIGLSSEPLTAGRSLLPPATRQRSPSTSSTGRTTTGTPSAPTSTGGTTGTSTTSTGSPAYTPPSTTAPERSETPSAGGEASSAAGKTTPTRQRSGEGDARARGDD